MTEEEDLLVTAGVVGSTIAVPFITNDTSILGSLAADVEIGINGQLQVDVEVENDAANDQDYYIGAAVIQPDGDAVNIRSERVQLSPGETGTVSLGPTSTGSLSPDSDGPESGITLFPEEGSYGLLVNVFNGREDDPTGSFGRVLTNRVDQERLSNAIQVVQTADADITRVTVNTTQVL
jgi:hypothetical protein